MLVLLNVSPLPMSSNKKIGDAFLRRSPLETKLSGKNKLWKEVHYSTQLKIGNMDQYHQPESRADKQLKQTN